MKKCARIQGPNGPCESSTYACDKNSYCDFTNRVCVARIAAGEECMPTGTNRCIDKHSCDEATSKCAPQRGPGQPCTKSTQCTENSCTNGKCGGGVSATDLLLMCQ